MLKIFALEGCDFFTFLRDLILEMGKLKALSRSFVIFSGVWWCFSGSFPVVVVVVSFRPKRRLRNKSPRQRQPGEG